MSRSLALLEEQLGVPLFHRVRQRLAPSDAGRLFATDAVAILARIDEATVKAMAFGGWRDVFNLAVLPTLAARWLSPSLPAFSTREPEIGPNVIACLTDVRFEAEGVDAAILRGNPHGIDADRVKTGSWT